jgi:hypothetical protein
MEETTSELLWKLANYQQAGVEPPDRLLTSPQLCEGDCMSEDEIEEFIKDSIATLRILADKQSPRWEAVAATYRLDLAALVELGRIDQDEYNELTAEQNLHF